MRTPRLALVAALAALAAGSATAGGLEVLQPAAPESESRLPIIELRGHAGARAPLGHDVVIAIDLSDSTTASSGHDLDGDGPEGRTSPALLQQIADRGADRATLVLLGEVDLEDSVLFAELTAAQALIARLDPRSFRVGLVAFSDGARVVAPVGSRPEVLRRALDGLRLDFWRDLKGTNFAEAIHVSLDALRPPPEEPAKGKRAPEPPLPPPSPREQSILLLSDGAPTRPVHGQRALEYAIYAAQDAALAGVRIYPFALGTQAEEGLDGYRALAAISGGRYERIARPADAIARLRRVDLADLAELRVENVTSGQPGRAVRTFPDGSFDALVPLAAGPNHLRVTAVAGDGSQASVERVVSYRAGGEVDDALRAQQQALLDELRRRTREVELWAEIERGRSFQVRELELEARGPAEEGNPPPSE